MKFSWTVLAAAVSVAILGIIAAEPALARAKHKAMPQCIDRPSQFSWNKLLFGPAPEPNGCAPPVYANGKYVGQDPDRYIRLQLQRDPTTGYSPL